MKIKSLAILLALPVLAFGQIEVNPPGVSPANSNLTGSTTVENLTVSGSTTANGNTTLGDASGDTLTINAGTITAPSGTSTASGNNLINLTTQNSRFQLGNPLNYGRGIWHLSTGGGATTLVGTGGGTLNAASMRLSTGATNNSSSLWRANSSQLTRFSKNTSTAGVGWTGAVWLIFAGQIDLRTAGILRIQLGRSATATTIADFSPAANTQGLGFYLTNGEIKIETCNATTRALSASLGTYDTAANSYLDLKARSDGLGGVRVWINGTEATAQTGGPTGSNGASESDFKVSIENATSGTSFFVDLVTGQLSVIAE